MCSRYLEENFGGVESEVRAQITPMIFPPTAEPTLPEQTLPIAFAHLRLLAGEDVTVVLKRLERLGRFFGAPAARAKIGIVYLMLAALTSTPGRLSSLVRAQAAFFSLLLRRVSDCLNQGVGEEEIRRELVDIWEIQGESAAEATLREARGLWRRMSADRLGIAPLSFDLGEWLGRNGLDERVRITRRMFAGAGEHPHLGELVFRLAAAEALGQSIREEGSGDRRTAWEETRRVLLESIAGGLEGWTPWEAEALRPRPLLMASLLAWGGRLRLLEGGETPTAHSGRERLPDWLREFLETTRKGEDIAAAGRFNVGGETYLVVGLEAKASPQLAMSSFGPTRREGTEKLDLRVQFGEGAQRDLRFDLSHGKDLLAALFFAEQPDIRLDLFVRGDDSRWRFGASVYLVPSDEMRAEWTRFVLEYLQERFGGEEDRIKLAILRGVKD